MNIELLTKIETLKKALANDARVKALNNANANLEASKEVFLLSEKFYEAQANYGDAVAAYPSASEEVLLSQQALHLAKKELDEHPLVRAYYEAYIPVRDLYWEIDETLFAPFRSVHVSCEK